MSEEKLTLRIWIEMANRTVTILKFLVDALWIHDNGFVLIMDIQAKAILISQGQQDMEYKFYEKLNANEKVIKAKSAIRLKTKIETIYKEVYEVQILNRFMMKLKVSGYTQGQRKEALLSGIRRYRRLEKLEEMVVTPLYSKVEIGWQERKRAKHEAKYSWYKKNT